MSVLNSISERFLMLLIALALSSCLKDNELNSSEVGVLEGRWQLQQISCYCYFEDYDFTANELWVSAKSSVMLSRNQNGQPLGISDNGIVTPIRVQGNELDDLISNRSYTFEVDANNLSISYIDNPDIADDEISYYFKRITDDCISWDNFNLQLACAEIYQPVCGCDGFSYSNACEASRYGVNVDYEGTCAGSSF